MLGILLIGFHVGRRGPKPVDVGLLQMYANEWSLFLYMLRDGKEAELYKLTTERTQRTDSEGGRHEHVVVHKRLFVAKFQPASEEARLLLKKSPPKPEGGEWVVDPPVLPAPEVWERFKSARSKVEVQKALTIMQKHVREVDLGVLTHLFTTAQEHAEAVLQAKRLPHYPRSRRQGSDNKRIDFFAKVLAGIALGLSPLTTTKRLSRWLPTIPLYSADLERERMKNKVKHETGI
jgi:hypothetical protein